MHYFFFVRNAIVIFVILTVKVNGKILYDIKGDDDMLFLESVLEHNKLDSWIYSTKGVHEFHLIIEALDRFQRKQLENLDSSFGNNTMADEVVTVSVLTWDMFNIDRFFFVKKEVNRFNNDRHGSSIVTGKLEYSIRLHIMSIIYDLLSYVFG